MNKEDFIKAGYTRWNPSPYELLATDLFQKCITDEKGKRYFINVTRWDFSPYEQNYVRYDASVQFETKSGLTVNMDCLDGWAIEEMEKYYADLWDLGWFDYYEHWEYQSAEDGNEGKN